MKEPPHKAAPLRLSVGPPPCVFQHGGVEERAESTAFQAVVLSTGPDLLRADPLNSAVERHARIAHRQVDAIGGGEYAVDTGPRIRVFTHIERQELDTPRSVSLGRRIVPKTRKPCSARSLPSRSRWRGRSQETLGLIHHM